MPYFDDTTSNLRKRHFSGGEGELHEDAAGNHQLRCTSSHRDGLIIVQEQELRGFLALPSDGVKSIKLRNSSTGVEMLVLIRPAKRWPVRNQVTPLETFDES